MSFFSRIFRFRTPPVRALPSPTDNLNDRFRVSEPLAGGTGATGPSPLSQATLDPGTSPAPAFRVHPDVCENKSPNAPRVDRSSAEHHDHPTVVEEVSHRNSPNDIASTNVTAKVQQTQAISLASAPSHPKISYTSPLHVSTEHTQSSPGGESLLIPSSLATSYPLPWESSATPRQPPQLYDAAEPLPQIVRSPAPPTVLLPRVESQLEVTSGNNGKALQDEKHEVKLDTQIKPPSPPATPNGSSSFPSPSSHESSPGSSLHSVQLIVESGRPPTSGGSPPVVTLDPSDKSSTSSESRASSSSSIVIQSLGGMAKSRVTTVSVSSRGAALAQEVSPAQVLPVQSTVVTTPLIDGRLQSTSTQSVPPQSSRHSQSGIPGTIDTSENALGLVLPSIGHSSAGVPLVDHAPDGPSPVSTIPATYPVLSPETGLLRQTESPRSVNAQGPGI